MPKTAGIATKRLSALVIALAVVATTAVVGAVPAHAAAPVLPSADPFYTYSGTTPLAQMKPGAILARRSVSLGLNATNLGVPALALPTGVTLPATAEQLLYRTSDELGRPSATVTTVIVPAAAAAQVALGSPNIVAYLSFYDSLSGKCDPSYTLQGGDPGSNNTGLTDAEQALVEAYAAADVVTVPDFEGEQLDWTAGHEAGYGTLDAVRATETYLDADPTKAQVGLTGYSGGSIAADWASELAPSYAKELNIVGVAEGGIPVDFAHNLDYIEGTSDWAPVIPATLATLSRSYGVDLSSYLSPEGLAAVKATRSQCIGDFGQFAGLTIQNLLKPEYRDPYSIAPFVKIINTLIMGTEPGNPKGPLYMEVGNDPDRKQGQGDDIMVTADVQALAHEYCEQNVPVQFTVASNSPHTQAAIPFEVGALAFLRQRFAGGAFESESCSQIGVGNSLAPVTLHRPSPAVPASTTGRTSTAAGAAGAAARRADLAFTGADPAVPIAALVLLAAGAGALAARRRR